MRALPTGRLRYSIPITWSFNRLNLRLSTDGKCLLTWGEDSVVHIRDFISGKMRGRLVFYHNATEWFFVAPDGRFDGSDGGIAIATLVVNDKPVPVRELDGRYRVPGLLAQVLGQGARP